MTVLKCKICGGSIQLAGKTHGICEYCGNEVTLPKIDDDKRAAMYDRANYFRQKCRFDEAREAFMQILADDQQDAEAYWQILLCRYGIEYVQDPVTGEHKPTCHRISYDPILEDPDYLNAIRYSDEYTKQLYRKEARTIAAIQEDYLAISSKVPPYDVFICFKQTDDLGRETQDCLDAGELYEELTQKGLKVFFSKWTLAEIPGVQYEPYIFSALNTAKVMLVVTSKLDNLNSPWVRNEWGRYLELRQKDKHKEMIVAYRNLSPYDFPLELQRQQGVDLSQITAKQTLVRGILRLLGKDKPSAQQTASVSATAQTLLTRARQSIEDGNFPEAKQFCNRILDADPENGWAYYYLLLASENAQDASMLRDDLDLPQNRNFLRAQQYADEELKAILKSTIERALQFQIYTRAKLYTKQEKYKEAIADYESIRGYRDTDSLLPRCREKLALQEAYNVAVKEFEEETQSEGNYLYERVNAEHPESLQAYMRLSENTHQRFIRSNHSGWAYTVIAGMIALFFGIYGLSQLLELGIFDNWNDLECFPLAILGCVFIWYTLRGWSLVGFIIDFWDEIGCLFSLIRLGLVAGSFILIYVPTAEGIINGKPVFTYIILAAGLIAAVIFVVQLCLIIKNGRFHKAAHTQESQIKNDLLPLHTAIIRALIKKYEPRIGKDETRKRLKNLIDTYPGDGLLFIFKHSYLVPEIYPLLGYPIPED